MINDTYLRQCVRDLIDGVNVYIYNENFIDDIANKYYQKNDKLLYLEKVRDYYILTTRKKKNNQMEINKK